jgi:hypothetical protein
MTDYAAIFIEIGVAGDLTERAAARAAVAFRLARACSPAASVHFTIGGYDDDPREIFEIPEVREYIRRWARLADVADVSAAMAVPWDQGMLYILAKSGVFPDDAQIRQVAGLP